MITKINIASMASVEENKKTPFNIFLHKILCFLNIHERETETIIIQHISETKVNVYSDKSEIKCIYCNKILRRKVYK